jgi:hypothetical protein
MKVTHTVTVLEGTPEELRQLDQWPAIVASLEQQPQTAATEDHDAPGQPASSSLPSELDNFIAKRGVNNPGRNLVRELAEQFLDSGEATWKIGTSSNSPDGMTPYFSLYAPGPQRVGAAAYIYPVNGRVTVRLMWNDADISEDFRAHAFRASEKSDSNYAVGVIVTTRAEFDAATQLIQLAIKRAREA